MDYIVAYLVIWVLIFLGIPAVDKVFGSGQPDGGTLEKSAGFATFWPLLIPFGLKVGVLYLLYLGFVLILQLIKKVID